MILISRILYFNTLFKRFVNNLVKVLSDFKKCLCDIIIVYSNKIFKIKYLSPLIIFNKKILRIPFDFATVVWVCIKQIIMCYYR